MDANRTHGKRMPIKSFSRRFNNSLKRRTSNVKTVKSNNSSVKTELKRTIDELATKSDEEDNEDPLNEGETVIYRSCEEIKSFEPNSVSEGYFIDPDGPPNEIPPICVYCNLTGSIPFILIFFN
jgi:hypothetical protein